MRCMDSCNSKKKHIMALLNVCQKVTTIKNNISNNVNINRTTYRSFSFAELRPECTDSRPSVVFVRSVEPAAVCWFS